MPHNYLFLLPECILLFGVLTLLLVGSFAKHNALQIVGKGALVLLVACLLVAIVEANYTLVGGAVSSFMFFDAFSLLGRSAVFFFAIPALLLGMNWLTRKKFNRFEYPLLFLCSVLGMVLAMAASNLLMLYLSLELMAFPLYLLAAYKRFGQRSTEAGVKYFLLGAFMSAIFFYGIVLFYGVVGETGYAAIQTALESGTHITLLTIAALLCLSGLFFKMGAAPFHMWVPDIYEGAPTPIAAFFATVPKLAIVLILARLLLWPFAPLFLSWRFLIGGASVLSLVIGTFGAVKQTSFKRLMGYSAVAHAGYILLGLYNGDAASMRAVSAYLFLYLPIVFGIFALLLSLYKERGLAEEITSVRGMARSHPVEAFLTAILFLSLAGIPPLSGFFAKYYVLQVAVEAGAWPLVLIAAICTVISVIYYIRPIGLMYFEPEEESVAHFSRLPYAILLIAAVFAVGIVWIPLEPLWTFLALSSQVLVL